jgi:hypothetical protein
MPSRHVSIQVAAFNIFDRFFDQKMPFECGKNLKSLKNIRVVDGGHTKTHTN